MASGALCVFVSLALDLLSEAHADEVLTRILPSGQLVLQPPSPSPGPQSPPPHGRAVVWCLVQDLDPFHHHVQSLELFFKSAPQVRTCPDADGDLFEGSFSQLGLPARQSVGEREDGEEEQGKEGDQWSEERGAGLVGGTEEDERSVLRSKGFPEAQFTEVTKDKTGSNSTNQNSSMPTGSRHVPRPDSPLDKAGSSTTNEHSSALKGPRGMPSPDSSLDRQGLLPGSVTVAMVAASTTAELGVQHLQRSGVSVRGVISSTNPNLSSLQVTIARAQCSDCGTYVCVLRYWDSLRHNLTQTRSSSNLIVAQSLTHRLNLRIKANLPPPPVMSENSDSKGVYSGAHTSTDLYCFGTISHPATAIGWRREKVSVDSNDTKADTPPVTRQGEPRLGQHCQHWRASILRHTWTGREELWRFRCFLSRDEGLTASALLSKSGSVVTATCGDPNSTTLTENGDTITVICDVKADMNVTSVTWLRGKRQVGGCEVTWNTTSWKCSTSQARYTVAGNGTRFVLTITTFDVTRDKGLWECLVTPLWSDSASACILG